MSEFVKLFKVKSTDYEAIKDILEYLDPSESVWFMYVDNCYFCEFSESVKIKCETFKEDFPNLEIWSTR